MHVMTTPPPRSLPDTTLVSPASGLYSTRMPRLLTLSSHERNAAAVPLSYKGSLCEVSLQRRSSWLPEYGPALDRGHPAAQTRHDGLHVARHRSGGG